jgi:hypothetical protein
MRCYFIHCVRFEQDINNSFKILMVTFLLKINSFIDSMTYYKYSYIKWLHRVCLYEAYVLQFPIDPFAININLKQIFLTQFIGNVHNCIHVYTTPSEKALKHRNYHICIKSYKYTTLPRCTSYMPVITCVSTNTDKWCYTYML